jgi:hypothetical protein
MNHKDLSYLFVPIWSQFLRLVLKGNLKAITAISETADYPRERRLLNDYAQKITRSTAISAPRLSASAWASHHICCAMSIVTFDLISTFTPLS